MVEKDKYLVVVSVRQGKNFPKRPKHALIVEAKFEGELLSTDPVEHNESPDFTQELAWELDKKALHQHRMQRTSVKIQVFCQDVVSSVREAIGYVILDLRSAQSHSVLKSYPLLHAKYKRSRPEIELSLYIDEGKPEIPNGERTKSVTDKASEGTSAKRFTESVDPKLLKPVFDDNYGFYQIGPAEDNMDKFLLTISINSAANLVQLVPTNVSLAPTGYFFYYSLLENDILTEIFHDLLNPRFPVEKVSTRLSGHLELIRQFFANQPGLEVHLCCGDQSLGSCVVPLNCLIKKGSSEIYMKPLLYGGSFQLMPPKSSKLAIPRILPDDEKPVVGISVVLQRETTADRSSPIKDVVNVKTVENQPITRGLGKGVGAEASEKPVPLVPQNEHDGSYIETLESRSKSDDKSKEQEQDSHKGNDVSSDTQHHLVVPAVPHHFCISVDLRSIANLNVTHPTSVFLKYTYLFFGSASPVLTEPPIEVRRGTEVNLPKSFCAFNFATTLQQMQETFTSFPLVVEVWERDRQLSQNTCLGVAEVVLANVLKSPKTKTVHSSGVSGWKQTSLDWFSVHSTDGEKSRLGDLQVNLTLVDWGTIVPQMVVVSGHPGSEEMSQSALDSPLPAAPVPAMHPRETLEYQAAMELELWKEQQQKMFEEELLVREKQHLKELEEEYRRRDKERQLLVAKQKAELNDLTEQMRKTLTELEKEEKRLASDKQKFLNDKTTLEREHMRKMTELQDASRRHKDDCDHQVALERKNVKELDENVAKLKQKLLEEESRYQRLSRDFEAYKSKASSQPEVRLQAEIIQLRMEKVDLEKQLEKAFQSKVQYKQQFVKACRELGKRDKKYLKESRAKERQRQREIEHLKLHYQMRKDTEAETKELNQIKKEKQELERSSGVTSRSGGITNGGVLRADLESEINEEDEHLVRLITERDLLLKTGTYMSSDSIIANLEQEIRELSKRKSEKTRHLGERTGNMIY